MTHTSASQWDPAAKRLAALRMGIERDSLDRAGNPLSGLEDSLAEQDKIIRPLIAASCPQALAAYEELHNRLIALSRQGEDIGFGPLADIHASFAKVMAAVPELKTHYRTPAEVAAQEHEAQMRFYAEDSLRWKLNDFHSRGQLAWFFDLDGTLVKSKPGVHTGVSADTELETTLNALASQSGGALAVVTGRPDIFVKALLPQSRFPSATESGAVLIDHGNDNARLRIAQRDLTKVRAQIEAQIAPIAGAYVEDYKRASLTIQFTDAADPPSHITFIKSLAEKIAADPAHHDAADPLQVIAACVPGNYVVDIAPASADKGEAVKHFMSQAAFTGHVPVFFGDSEGDRKGMELCRHLGGIAVGVGPAAPECADIRLHDVPAARALLRKMADSRKPAAPHL